MSAAVEMRASLHMVLARLGEGDDTGPTTEEEWTAIAIALASAKAMAVNARQAVRDAAVCSCGGKTIAGSFVHAKRCTRRFGKPAA